MDTLVKYLCILTTITLCYCKDWHIKEDQDLKKKDDYLPFLNKYNHMPSPERERFVRHVEMTVTETVIEHLINEINKKYPETRSGAKNSTMPKLIKKLKSKLRKQMKKKNINRHKKMRNSKGITKTVENTTKLSIF